MAALLCAFCVLIFNQYKSEFSAAVKIAGCIFILFSAVATFTPVFEFAKNIAEGSAVSPYLPILLKTLGIAFLTQCTADICRDLGESAVASNIELAGKAEIVLLGIPIIKEIIMLAEDIVS